MGEASFDSYLNAHSLVIQVPARTQRFTKEGYQILDREEKDIILDKEMLVTSWDFRTATSGYTYVVVNAILRRDDDVAQKVQFSDGGATMLAFLEAQEPGVTLHIPKGVRRSDYEVDGEPRSSYHFNH